MDFQEEGLAHALVPAVQEQLNSKQTPFVKKHFQRLIGVEQIPEEEALLMLALCLADESNRMFLDQREFDLKRYRELIEELPQLPPEPS